MSKEETTEKLEITTAEHISTEVETGGKRFILAVQIADGVSIARGDPIDLAVQAMRDTVEEIARTASDAIDAIDNSEMVGIDWRTSVRVTDTAVMRKIAATALWSLRAAGYDASLVTLRLIDNLPRTVSVVAVPRCPLLVSHEAIMARTVAADNLALSVETPPK